MTASIEQSPAVPADLQTAHGFDPAQSAGLFVGVSRFDDSFAPVPFAVDDAVDLAHLFAFELRLMTPAKVVLGLAGDPQKPDSATRLDALRAGGTAVVSARQTEVYARLDAQRRAAGPNGLFVASIATHGFSDQGGDFLVAQDSLRRRIERTGVAVAELFDDVARSPSPRRLVLLDACRERLSADTRAGGEAQAAMSSSFAAAIAGASGQAVLAGATLGGYAYDDPARRNGVFTGTLLDGLRGRAPVDERGFITVRTLADYADREVVQWVRDHRPDHASVSQGIARRIEGAASTLPLALDPVRRQAEEAWHARRADALALLRENIGGILTGGFYDQVVAVLNGEGSRADLEALLEEIEALDGAARSQRSLAYFFQQHSGQPVAPGVSGTGSVPLGTLGTGTMPLPVAALQEPAVTDGGGTEITDPPGTARRNQRWLFVAGGLLALAVVAWLGLRPILTTEPSSPGGSDETELAASVPPAETSAPPLEVTDGDGAGAEKAPADQEPTPPLPEPAVTEPATSSATSGSKKPEVRDSSQVPRPPSRQTPAPEGGTRSSGVASGSEEERPPKAGELKKGPLGMRFRYAPAGKFKMGSPETEVRRDDDEVLHEVELTRGFWIGETEVTQGQWRQLMESDPSYFKNCGKDCPVERVSWYEAVMFANRLSDREELTSCYVIEGCEGALGSGCKDGELYCFGEYSCTTANLKNLECDGFRLPTEAEWEYAARVGEEGPIYSGGLRINGARNAPGLGKIAWYGGNSGVSYSDGYDCSGWAEKESPSKTCGTQRVGRKPSNEWQLHDMLGNVWEWTGDWYNAYPAGAGDDPMGPGRGSYRVLRGGGWYSHARYCRSAYRHRFDPGIRYADIGFRLVRTAD